LKGISHSVSKVDRKGGIIVDFLTPELVALAKNAADVIGKNTVPAVINKVKVARETKDHKEAIGQFEGIIQDLISEKNELINIVQAYERELILRKISNDDIEYITEKLAPILEQLVLNSNSSEDEDEARKIAETVELLKPIVSKETFNILQLLGFNFKEAIGEPLTQLLKSKITSNISTEHAERLLSHQRDIEYWKAVQNTEGFKLHLGGRQNNID